MDCGDLAGQIFQSHELVLIMDSFSCSSFNSAFHLLKKGPQNSHRLEKYLNLEGFLERSLKIKSALKSTGKSLKSLDKYLNSTIFCRPK